MSADPSKPLPRLLLIDDDFISREVLALVLETYGFPIESAADGAEALELLDKADATLPDVILMDTQMPGLSGLDLIAALRNRGAAHAGIKIIAISGSPVEDSIRNATDGFLLKPIEAEDVHSLLETGFADAVTASKANGHAALDQVVDPVVLGKLRAMMPAASVLEIYTAVAADLKTRLVTLSDAMNKNQAQEVARIAHAIKGGCAMVGLKSAQEAASRLETSNAPGAWPAELAQIRNAFEALEGMLSADLLT
jgi:CheY-like chemotaxis protein